jgi:Matrixin
MLDRRSLPFVGRLLTAAVAAVAAVGVVDCATFTSSANDGSVDGMLSPRAGGTVVTRATLGDVLSSASGTYIGRLLADRDSTLERWPARLDRPLRIWIDSSAMVSGGQAAFPSAVREAFAQWVGTGIPLRLVYVTSERDANIRVRWTDYLTRKTGSTTWRTDRFGYLTSGDITLATHISDGQALDKRGMRAIALHEVGHALGMSHSLDEHDVMASLVRVDGLSVSDRGTIKLLYALPAGHVR